MVQIFNLVCVIISDFALVLFNYLFYLKSNICWIGFFYVVLILILFFCFLLNIYLFCFCKYLIYLFSLIFIFI